MDLSVSYPREPGTPVSHLPFSPCVKVGPLVFVSGQASVDLTGKIVSDTFEGEFRRSVENLRNYVRDAEDLPTFNRLYREYFAEPYPARTTITGCLSEALRFEIECVAVCAEQGVA